MILKDMIIFMYYSELYTVYKFIKHIIKFYI